MCFLVNWDLCSGLDSAEGPLAGETLLCMSLSLLWGQLSSLFIVVTQVQEAGPFSKDYFFMFLLASFLLKLIAKASHMAKYRIKGQRNMLHLLLEEQQSLMAKFIDRGRRH